MDGAGGRVLIIAPDGRCVEEIADDRHLVSVRDELCTEWPGVSPELFRGGWVASSGRWVSAESRLQDLANETVVLWTVPERLALAEAWGQGSNYRFGAYWSLPPVCWSAAGYAATALELGKIEIHRVNLDAILTGFAHDLDRLVKVTPEDQPEQEAQVQRALTLRSRKQQWTRQMRTNVQKTVEAWLARHHARAALAPPQAAQAQQSEGAESQGEEGKPSDGQGARKRQRDGGDDEEEEDGDDGSTTRKKKGRVDDAAGPQEHHGPNYILGCKFPPNGYLIPYHFKAAHFLRPLTGETLAGWSLQGVDTVVYVDLDGDFLISAKSALPHNLLIIAIYQNHWPARKSVEDPAVLDHIQRGRLHFTEGTDTVMNGLPSTLAGGAHVPKHTRHFYVSQDSGFARRVIVAQARGINACLLQTCKDLDDVASEVTQAMAGGALVQPLAGAAGAGGVLQQQQPAHTSAASDGRTAAAAATTTTTVDSSATGVTGSGSGSPEAASAGVNGSLVDAAAREAQQAHVQQLLRSPASSVLIGRVTVIVHVHNHHH